MGNSATKEQRLPSNRLRSVDRRRASSPTISGSHSLPSQPSEEPSTHPLYSSRNGRSSRSELSSLLGIVNPTDRDLTDVEHRRETRQEREAKRVQKEKIMRERERERSMREENVDGGFLVTQGVYTGIEDYNKSVVRQLMIERRLAPFWRGLNDYSNSWTENQLVAAATGRPVPAPDEIPAENNIDPFPVRESKDKSSKNINNLTVPMSSRSQSFNSDSSSNLSPSNPVFSLPGLPASSSSGSTFFRGRSKTIASLTTPAKAPQSDVTPQEMNLPKDPFVNGQPIEAYLYKDAAECPICFLYYPPYLNKTRCCDQAICSECFVQIKRPDPHPPEHVDSAVPPLPLTENVESEDVEVDGALVSEPAACPFCVQPQFGITYETPPFRRGLIYMNRGSTHPLANPNEAMSSSSSLASAKSIGTQISPAVFSRRRTTSVSATSSTVITTDRIRPDWHQKLAGARAHAARRSAAATALHTAAYLIGNRNHESDARGFAAFSRRNMLRRAGGNDALPVGASAAHMNMLALMSERYAASEPLSEGSASGLVPANASSRRSRMDDLEEMMMMEAIRLSLASEEERQKREEKEAKKEAKKKDKENKKAEKTARRTATYQSRPEHAITSLDRPTNDFTSSVVSLPGDKGKEILRSGVPTAERSSDANPTSSMAVSFLPEEVTAESAQSHLERARAQLQPSDALPTPCTSNPYRPSHLRNLSNASSSGSSVEDSAIASLDHGFHQSNSSFEASPDSSRVNILLRGSTQDTVLSGTPPGGGAGIEPIFNFRSLAAMVGKDETSDPKVSVEHARKSLDNESQKGSRSIDGSDTIGVGSGAQTIMATTHSSSRANIHHGYHDEASDFKGLEARINIDGTEGIS